MGRDREKRCSQKDAHKNKAQSPSARAAAVHERALCGLRERALCGLRAAAVREVPCAG